MTATAFISYSHKDEQYRIELQEHLMSLKHQGILDTWHDRKISAGQEVDGKIFEKLQSAEIILLLVSPSFISSEYCFSTEMSEAMRRHEAREACVIPVILRPCDWHDLPFGKLLATPTDGQAISSSEDRDAAYLDVTKSIKKVAKELLTANPGAPRKNSSHSTKAARFQGPSHSVSKHRSNSIDLHRPYTDFDKDVFLHQSFEFICKFFENSLTALSEVNAGIQINFRQIDANGFEAYIYHAGTLCSKSGVWISNDHTLKCINYSAQGLGQRNSYNESLTVEVSENSLMLKPLTGLFHGLKTDTPLTIDLAAEHLWLMLLEPLRS